ncbi:MAG: OsmC family protein [Bacteroidales bacterium]|nr:OsmC family protein [Bacteroidales bacterium]
MKEVVNVNWLDNMGFEADVRGFKLTLDATENVGGKNRGPQPKPLMLVSLAGCTGMDVVSILKKMKVDFKKFNVRVEGDLTEEHPKHFTKMHIIYEFTGKDLPMSKLEKAVNLSQERYCGVSFNYRDAFELTHEIKVFEEL